MNINDLFDIAGNKIQLSAAALAMPVFGIIYDSFEDKFRAEKEIEYIILQNHWQSAYQQILDDNKRREVVKRDLFHDVNYGISPITKESERRYVEEFQTHEMLQLIHAARIGIQYCIEEFEALRNDKTTPAKEVFKWLKDVGSVAKSFDILEKAVKAGSIDSSKVRGGAELNTFELPRKK
jgi:hypothetical protein